VNYRASAPQAEEVVATIAAAGGEAMAIKADVTVPIHEELIAYVANQDGHFEEEGLQVAVRDGIRWKTERLRGGVTIGLGRTLLSRLSDGIQWTMLAVNTHRPRFWFIGRGDLKSKDDLRGRRLAVHAPRPAPGCFARIVLRRQPL
jgi:hypothetical protein